MRGRRDLPVTVAHKIQNVTTAADKEQFHDRVVQRYETEEEIGVACHENRHIESLRFKRYTWKVRDSVSE